MPVVVAPTGRISTAPDSSEAEQTGGFGQDRAKVIVHLPPLVPLPTVMRPALSLPAIDGLVPQSVEPAATLGVVPVKIWCPSIPSVAAVRGVADTTLSLRKNPW